MLPEKAAIVAAAVGLVLAFAAERLVHNRRDLGVFPGAGLALASLLLAGGIALRWQRLGQGPFMTLFEILLSNLFSLTFIYMCLFIAIPGARRGWPVVLALLLLLSAWALMAPGVSVTLPPTFDHPWLWVHVLTGKVFLGLCMTAAALSLVGLLRSSSAWSVEALVWNLCAAAFVFHGGMLVAGAVWANDAWGRFWSWDPLETWSLVTWIALAALLHARVTYTMPPRLGPVLVILVFALAFLTFFGVPFVSLAPHKGVM